MATTSPQSETVVAEVRPGDYGAKVIAVEPGGAEFVPLRERHGRPAQLLWTWLSPNLEFATVFLGVLATGIIGLSFWQAALAILVGPGLGSFTHGVLSGRGPRYGVPQMVLSRISFGWFGNALPAGLNAVIAGIGWFAVNSVSGALALNALTSLPKWLCLLVVVVLQIVIAFFGHNLVQVFERRAGPHGHLRGGLRDHLRQGRRRVAGGHRGGPRRVPGHRRGPLRLRGPLDPPLPRVHPLPAAARPARRHGPVRRPRRLPL